MFALARYRKAGIVDALSVYARKLGRVRFLAAVLAVMSMVSGLATYFSIYRSESIFAPDPNVVISLVVINLILLLSLIGLVSRRIFGLAVERRKGSVGSRLQTKIVFMFSLVAIVPTVIMTVFSIVFFNFGIQTWFDKKVSTAIEGSVAIAESYLEEHKKIIGADILGMANDINRDAYNIRRNPMSFDHKVSLLATIRKLPEAIVFQRTYEGNVILARSQLSNSLQFVLEDMSDGIIHSAAKGEIVTVTSDSEDRVIALVRLESFFDTYLLVGRFVDNRIINHIEVTKGASNEYNKLKSEISGLQIKFFFVFVLVSLLLLLVVIWYGIHFAVNIVKPVKSLVAATQKVKEGDLSARVFEGHEDDEIATLGRAFNRMTQQLEHQRAELISAQRRIAWSDVARRIAHEIKNPLTPIQLAAERIKRKYSGEVADDNFKKYINTIIRNVNVIGSMVDEFVSFARIPAPVFKKTDLYELINELIISRDGTNGISYQQDLMDEPAIINCDEDQISRVLINLLKNSEESIEERIKDEKKSKEGIIGVKLFKNKEKLCIEIWDNGKGFPENLLERLTEPYVTTKSKGTGLGLAIVEKIVEDHNGKFEFKNIDEWACVSLIFPIAEIS